ncbi:MAG: hypothetical protein EHM87_01500, partial [Burkholderiales bacterium]
MSALLAMWMMGLAALAALTPAHPSLPSTEPSGEVVMVEGQGPVPLEAVECVAIARSATVSRLCHDPARSLAYAEVQGRFRPFCDVDRSLLDAWLAAPSMGRFLV